MTRARERGALGRFEQEKLSFFAKVRAGYEALWQAEPERIKRLDATQNADVVFEEALNYIKQLLELFYCNLFDIIVN